MKYLSCQALTINAFSYGESHRIVRFFSRERGRISAVAHGARKQLSKFSMVSEPATLSRLVLAENPRSDLYTLKEAEVLDSFYRVKQSYENLSVLFDLLRMLDASAQDYDADAAIFDFLAAALHAFDTAVLNGAAMHVLSGLTGLRMQGRLPDWESCSMCQRHSLSLLLSGGHVVCRHCTERYDMLLDQDMLDALKYLGGLELDASRIRNMPLERMGKLLDALLHYNLLDKSNKKEHAGLYE